MAEKLEKKQESKLAQMKAMLQDINYNMLKIQESLVNIKVNAVTSVIETEGRLWGLRTPEPNNQTEGQSAGVIEWERNMDSLAEDIQFVANNSTSLKLIAESIDESIYKETNELKQKLLF